MGDLLEAIKKVSGNTDPSKAKLNFETLDNEFFASEVKPTVVPQAPAVQQSSPSSAQIASVTPVTSTESTPISTSEPIVSNTNDNALDAKAMIGLVNVVLARILQAGFAFGGIESTAEQFQLTADE